MWWNSLLMWPCFSFLNYLNHLPSLSHQMQLPCWFCWHSTTPKSEHLKPLCLLLVSSFRRESNVLLVYTEYLDETDLWGLRICPARVRHCFIFKCLTGAIVPGVLDTLTIAMGHCCTIQALWLSNFEQLLSDQKSSILCIPKQQTFTVPQKYHGATWCLIFKTRGTVFFFVNLKKSENSTVTNDIYRNTLALKQLIWFLRTAWFCNVTSAFDNMLQKLTAQVISSWYICKQHSQNVLAKSWLWYAPHTMLVCPFAHVDHVNNHVCWNLHSAHFHFYQSYNNGALMELMLKKYNSSLPRVTSPGTTTDLSLQMNLPCK